MQKETIYVIGHKNPDTDSVCSAIGLAELKTAEGLENVTAAMAGDLNPQTSFILNYFNVQAPKYISTVYPRAKDIMSADVVYITGDTPLLKVMELIKDHNVRFIPVVDSDKKPTGILTLMDIAKEYISHCEMESPKKIFTTMSNIIETLNAKPVLDFSKGSESSFCVFVGAMEEDSFLKFVGAKDPKECIIIVGDRENIQRLAVEKGIGLLVITGGLSVNNTIVKAAEEKGVSIIISPFDSAATAFLVRLSLPASHIAGRVFEKAGVDDLAEDLQKRMAGNPENGFIVLDNNGIMQGVITKSNLLRESGISLILVDHNELSQAVDGADKIRIIEVLDHHRLGNFHTIQPIPFICKPVGSTSTLVADLYRTKNIAIKKETAGILLGGLLSDTVILKSPTTTDMDKDIAVWLEEKAGVGYKKFGNEIFAATASIKKRGAHAVVNSDFKIYETKTANFGIGQVETVGFDEFYEVKDAVKDELRKNAETDKLKLAAVLVTDIVIGTSLLLAIGSEEILYSLGYPRLEENIYELKNVISRKKQVAPHILRLFNELFI